MRSGELLRTALNVAGSHAPPQLCRPRLPAAPPSTTSAWARWASCWACWMAWRVRRAAAGASGRGDWRIVGRPVQEQSRHDASPLAPPPAELSLVHCNDLFAAGSPLPTVAMLSGLRSLTLDDVQVWRLEVLSSGGSSSQEASPRAFRPPRRPPADLFSHPPYAPTRLQCRLYREPLAELGRLTQLTQLTISSTQRHGELAGARRGLVGRVPGTLPASPAACRLCLTPLAPSAPMPSAAPARRLPLWHGRRPGHLGLPVQPPQPRAPRQRPARGAPRLAAGRHASP